jgi:hypothetical protein
LKYPQNRFWATVAAQTAGVLLLFFIAIIFDVGKQCQLAIEPGVQTVFVVAFLVFVGLVVGFLRGFMPAQECGFDDPCVNRTIKTYLWVDISLLTILIALEGGLVHSMFWPLFVLIPIAHNTVEQTGKKQRVVKVVLIIIGCTVIIFLFSIFGDGMNYLFRFSFLPITDFSTLAPKRFAFATAFVSIVSSLIFILSLKIIRMPPGVFSSAVEQTSKLVK